VGFGPASGVVARGSFGISPAPLPPGLALGAGATSSGFTSEGLQPHKIADTTPAHKTIAKRFFKFFMMTFVQAYCGRSAAVLIQVPVVVAGWPH
jgi:hypothetical protein